MKDNFLLPLESSAYISSAQRNNKRQKLDLCNGSVIPPSIRGFDGPMNYVQLHGLLNRNEMPLNLEVNSSLTDNKFVYYLCYERKVLNIFTNQRFFRLPCDSPHLQPSISIMNWPQCNKPTHCIGKPDIR